MLAFSTRKNRLSLSVRSRMLVRATSPPLGSSSLITSAPRKPRICAQAGPAWLWVMSMTRMPDSAWLMRFLPLHARMLGRVCLTCHAPGHAPALDATGEADESGGTGNVEAALWAIVRPCSITETLKGECQ